MDSSAFIWPNGFKGAVSLTYDDGRHSNVELAIPQLNRNGLRGTFYLTNASNYLLGQIEDWKSVAASQHEIGDHSWQHPMNPASIEDSDPSTGGPIEYWSQYDEYTFYRDQIDPLEYEITSRISGKFANKPRTWAYPCGVMRLKSPDQEGADRYERAIRCNFRAARAHYDDPADLGPQNPLTVAQRRYQIAAKVPTWGYVKSDHAIDYMNDAIMRHRWAVLIFHDVFNREPQNDGETSERVHQEILTWIKDHQIWCAPFGEVFDYVMSKLPSEVTMPSNQKSIPNCQGLGA
jgi:peptidoglycan/xylan/chitin deacetylase (PgdA/CDA1 family)